MHIYSYPISRGLFLSILLAGVLATTAKPAAAQEKILRWHDNLDRAAQASRESGKPLFVVFRCVR